MVLLFETLPEALLRHAEEEPNRTALYMLDKQNKEEPLTYSQVRDRSLAFAAYLRNHGLRQGDAVAIMLPNCAAFIYLFFGTLLAGGVPIPTYPPSSLADNALFIRNLKHIFDNSQARFFGTNPRILESFVSNLNELKSLEHVFNAESIEGDAGTDIDLGSFAKAGHQDIALVQYTSGSTGFSKGVVLSHQNLTNNIQGIIDALKIDRKTDVGLSWLPLFHDMGLIGCLLTSIYIGAPLVLMPTESFIRRPARWLENISKYRATLSPSPNFGYHLCTRLVRPSRIKDLDLSSWRAALSGAEAVDISVIERFSERFHPFGFNDKAFIPAYGLAESSLAVSLHPLGSKLTIASLDRRKLESQSLAIPYDGDDVNLALIPSMGVPIPGQEVSIRSMDGCPLEDNKVGEIWVRGLSVTRGYYNDEKATADSFQDGWLKTGDLGFQDKGQLYITGRIKELIIKRGRNYSPTDIERCVWQIEGIREGRCAALAVWNPAASIDDLVIVLELEKQLEETELAELTRRINDAVLEAIGIRPNRTVFVAPKSIPKTSSGKIQRLLCKKLLTDGRIEVYGEIRPKKRRQLDS